MRAVQANLPTGPKQYYDEDASRIFQGLQPTVATLQEFRLEEDTTENQRAYLEQAFGQGIHFFHEPGKRKTRPNLIVSKYGFLETGTIQDPYVDDRDMIYARIDIPGRTKLWVFSVHFVRSDWKKRNKQARLLRDFISEHVTEDDYLLVGGDFNADGWNDGSLEILKPLVTTEHHPTDSVGNEATNIFGNRVMDFLLPNPRLNSFHQCTKLFRGLAPGEEGPVFPHGMVMDSKTFIPLRALSPVRRNDSNGPFQQHKAVVKDFLLPE